GGRAHAAAQQHEQATQQDEQRSERQPVDEIATERRVERIERNQRGAGFAPHQRVEVDQQMGHLGDHPHADGKLAAPEPQHRKAKRYGNHADDDRGADHAHERVHAPVGELDGEVGAKSDKELLADTDEASVARERVPHHGKDDVDEKDRQPVHRAGPEPEWRNRRDHGERDDHSDGRARGGGPPFDAESRLRVYAGLLRKARTPPASQTRTNSTTRKTPWPASRKPSGDTFAPKVCASASTIPPISVPHTEPAPPITAASKAKSNCDAPA